MASENQTFALYAFGSNGSGQLGIAHNLDVSVPKQVQFHPPPPSQLPPPTITAGGNHTLLLFPSGQLFWSGDNSTGACGPTTSTPTTPSNSTPQFKPISLPPDLDSNISTDNHKISLCATTWESTTIITKNTDTKSSRIYTFGLGNKGELGLGPLIFRTTTPHPIPNFPPPNLEIKDVASSVSHTVIVLSNGEVYGWGNGRKGQLGLPEGIVYEPRKIEGVGFGVGRVVCGREFTYFLEGGGEVEGRHLVIGSDRWGVVSSMPGGMMRDWKDVGASWGSLFVLGNDGRLLSWGRNDHGQLAPGGLPSLAEIAVGSEHVLARTTAGDVIAWGWGEHGNCGPDTVDGDVKDRFNVVASSKILTQAGSKVTKLGAGCATSWIWTEVDQ